MTKAKGGYKTKPNGKKDTGRHSVMTPETINKLEQAYSIDATDEEACIFAGIGMSTLYDYQKQNPEFSERKRLLKDKLTFKARTNIANEINKGDADLSKWYLERKKKKEFSTQVVNEITFSMTDEEVNEVEAVLFGLDKK